MKSQGKACQTNIDADNIYVKSIPKGYESISQQPSCGLHDLPFTHALHVCLMCEDGDVEGALGEGGSLV